jgi:hypothetical protein
MRKLTTALVLAALAIATASTGAATADSGATHTRTATVISNGDTGWGSTCPPPGGVTPPPPHCVVLPGF